MVVRGKGVFEQLWSSATSRGIGYEPQPRGRHLSRDAPRGYFVDLTAKVDHADLDPPERRAPAGLAQLALAYHERHLDGDQPAGSEFKRCCELLASQGVPASDGMLWPYPMAVTKYRLRPPWYSAMAQGQVASVFVRAAIATGSDRFAELAMEAIGPLLAGSAGLVTKTPDGPVLEEAPSRPASQILNGWIYAAWGLWDVAHAFGDERAQSLLDETMLCLRRRLVLYDTGWWSRYSLYPHRITDLAKPFYHRIHATQLAILHELLGWSEFGETASRWRSYDRLPYRLFAVGQKGAFVTLGRLHRRMVT